MEDWIKHLTNVPILVFGIVFTSSLTFAYSIILHWMVGQTVGKMVMKIRVVHVSEERLLSLREAFMRDAVYLVLEVLGILVLVFQIIKLGRYPTSDSMVESFLSWLGFFWFLVEIVTMLNNPKRGAFHDLMAGSFVISDYFSKTTKQ
jgi:uncharacterized RDD family membrane protein YckC